MHRTAPTSRIFACAGSKTFDLARTGIKGLVRNGPEIQYGCVSFRTTGHFVSRLTTNYVASPSHWRVAGSRRKMNRSVSTTSSRVRPNNGR